MNRLIIKQWICVLSFTVGIVLFSGCNRDNYYSGGGNSTEYSFIEPMQVVEVDAQTKSFRIVVDLLEGEGSPLVYIDTLNTTARHKVHFINHVELPFNSIGDFTPMDSDRLFYRDVELIPEKIINEVSIFYYIRSGNIELNDRLEVVLRPIITKNQCNAK